MAEDCVKMIESGSELRAWFFNTLKYRPKPRHYEKLCKGVYVDAKVRREVLTGMNQGKITLEGQIKDILFESLGGGVYRACVAFVINSDESLEDGK